jgi:hypothetical protein
VVEVQCRFCLKTSRCNFTGSKNDLRLLAQAVLRAWVLQQQSMKQQHLSPKAFGGNTSTLQHPTIGAATKSQALTSKESLNYTQAESPDVLLSMLEYYLLQKHIKLNVTCSTFCIDIFTSYLIEFVPIFQTTVSMHPQEFLEVLAYHSIQCNMERDNPQ